LEQYLYIHYNYQQDNWLDLFLLAEFTYNNVFSTTTSISLFFANKDYYSNINMYLEHDIASFCTYDFVINLNNIQNILKAEIFTIQ